VKLFPALSANFRKLSLDSVGTFHTTCPVSNISFPYSANNRHCRKVASSMVVICEICPFRHRPTPHPPPASQILLKLPHAAKAPAATLPPRRRRTAIPGDTAFVLAQLELRVPKTSFSCRVAPNSLLWRAIPSHPFPSAPSLVPSPN
jgi:hypothetical protein